MAPAEAHRKPPIGQWSSTARPAFGRRGREAAGADIPVFAYRMEIGIGPSVARDAALPGDAGADGAFLPGKAVEPEGADFSMVLMTHVA